MKKTYLWLTFLVSMVTASPAFSKNVEGTVDNLRPGLIIINVWGDNLEDNFKITPTTGLQSIHSLDDLKVRDQVHIYYLGEGYHKTATSIVKVNPSNKVTVF